jgi:large subunit ribosomal protein L21
MYAVVKTGGKQYRVSEGDLVRVEKLDAEVGSEVTLSDVMLINDGDNTKVGTPTVDGASVTATVVELGKSKKVIIFKKKRRKGYSLKKGHRQQYMALKIDKITV